MSKQQTDELVAAIDKVFKEKRTVQKPVDKPTPSSGKGSCPNDEDYREQVRRWRYVQQYMIAF